MRPFNLENITSLFLASTCSMMSSGSFQFGPVSGLDARAKKRRSIYSRHIHLPSYGKKVDDIASRHSDKGDMALRVLRNQLV